MTAQVSENERDVYPFISGRKFIHMSFIYVMFVTEHERFPQPPIQRKSWLRHLRAENWITSLSQNRCMLPIPIEIIEKHATVRIVTKNEVESIIESDNSALIKAIAHGYYWRERLINSDKW